uniref:Glycosyltransferase n=1 Tax=Linum usitatissimum TaxID=4006 RepID=I2BHD3_LINUS|nr:UDP-glycosyltransferase 1 [Linum usitatissimum]
MDSVAAADISTATTTTLHQNGNGGATHIHAVLFPFMSKGHTIPLLHLARLLLRRQISVTIFTTPANRPFISSALPDDSASILELPFPHEIPGIPAGVESTDKLPSMSLFPQFALSTEKYLRPQFDSALQNLNPRPTFMVSDGFLWWTQDTAEKFGIPRLTFYGMSNHAASVSRAVAIDRLLLGPESEDELITVTQLPWMKVCKNDFHEDSRSPEPKGVNAEFIWKSVMASSRSFGYVMNSFYELESVFVDYLNGLGSQKHHCVGPLCLADDENDAVGNNKDENPWMSWLDKKLEEGKSVLYVAFGSQAEISREQLEEIARGLEDSEANYLWVIRKDAEVVRGVGNNKDHRRRGMVIGDWVNQMEILGHKSVKGFMSHCGWNSVMESVCAGVPMVAWPMMAEQPLNARMVAEEIKVGIRVEGSGRNGRLVKKGAVEEAVRELMAGEKGKEVRKNVEAFAEKAIKSMEKGSGSSWRTLDGLVRELWSYKAIAEK